ncbi:torsin-1A [Chelonus insularis]|uniref:torsin-1A n=1 Tax=Chelonus insularis TaxID=460826 RepID=UPI00158CD865|nr:torsin-1A [Chelonus insularis]
MHYFRIRFIIFYLIYLQEASSFYNYLRSGFNHVVCSYQECCNEKYIKKNITELNERLRTKLFGQHIVNKELISALGAHINVREPKKALVMNFHGPGGTGKNYVARMIIETFYEKKVESNYVHLFIGRINFPLESKKQEYKEDLVKILIESLSKCPESLFVFDEVDMIVPGVLDVLVPFMDYGTTQIWHMGQKYQLTTNKAIFIFLSNTGSREIIQTLSNAWLSGKKREELSLADFEALMAKGAFNEGGGFYKSDTIQSHLIDHYIPFLPLETRHVLLCIEEEFKIKGHTPTSEQIDKVMEYISWDPDHQIYASSGCKKIASKVSSILYRQKLHKEL